MNNESPPQTMTYVALIILALVVLFVSIIAKDLAVINRTDAQVIRMQSKKAGAPTAQVAEEPFSFAGKNIDQAIHANFRRIAMSLQPQMNTCLKKWPNHPDSTLIHIETDAAGRLTRLDVQGASPVTTQCFQNALSLGQFTRRASGIAEMNMTRGRSRNEWEYH